MPFIAKTAIFSKKPIFWKNETFPVFFQQFEKSSFLKTIYYINVYTYIIYTCIYIYYFLKILFSVSIGSNGGSTGVLDTDGIIL